MTLTPEVRWAQRSSDSDSEKNYLLVTIAVPDCEDPELKLEPSYLEFTSKNKGHVGDETSHHYHLHIDFFKEVIPEKSLHKVANGQSYFLKIFKKDLDSEYWPRLTKEKVRYNYIKTDFNKWVDEDEQETAPPAPGADFGDLMGGMPGMGDMGGMPGMGGMGGMPGMGDMGGMPGMGGMGGMPGMGGTPDLEALKAQLSQAGALDGEEEEEEEEEEQEKN